MAFVQWDERLCVNIKEIDDQHKYLFQLINNLHNSLREGQGDTIIKPILSSLVEYVIIHFATEEKWMKKYNYPELKQHKQEHQVYVTEIKGFISKYKKKTPLLAQDILLSLGGWCRIHIREYDKKFGDFLEDKNIQLDNQ